ncbi:MAG: hypothetical protein AUJ55_13195 [Proteobacteria bacterium CG1_02_64_396]|nr:MAG: hypothetical protein AUJ55_13195 [Proteobacteria bacterium CG1_02_64_396]
MVLGVGWALSALAGDLPDNMGRGVQVSAAGPKRVALVIGNHHYQTLESLPVAGADAEALARRLEETGFEVLRRNDLDTGAMKKAVRQFKAALSPGDEAIFAFAGYGVAEEGVDYLLPVDIVGESIDRIRDDALSLQRVLDDLQDKQPRFALAIVDTCRGNPFVGGATGLGHERGMAAISAGNGQMILFSAGVGQAALERTGTDDATAQSLFVRALVEAMGQPGVEIRPLVRQVRDRVAALAAQSGGEQFPALYDQAQGDFFFYPPAAGSAAGVPQGVGPLEQEFWDAIAQSDDPALYLAYLEQYPNGFYAEQARQKGGVQTMPAREQEPQVKGERFTVRGIRFEMVEIPGGNFFMGGDDLWASSEQQPRHEVALAPFQIMQTEVTQALWQAVMGYNEQEYKGDNLPVYQVTWRDAQRFADKLSQMTGKRFRLPSESQWEYAARGGTTSVWFWGDDESQMPQYAWIPENSDKQPHPVAQKRPNPWGLYDMTGNAWEWCQDVFHEDYRGGMFNRRPDDGSAWESEGVEDERVIRGGAFDAMFNLDFRSDARSGRDQGQHWAGVRLVWIPGEGGE